MAGHYRVVERTVAAQSIDDGGYAGGFLSDGHIDAVHRLAGLEVLPLIDDCVDGDGRLAYLAVADDEFALSAAYGHHCVDGFKACLQRLLHGLTVDYAGGFSFQRHEQALALDGSPAVDRLAQHIYDTPEKAFAHGDGSDFAGALHLHALGDGVDVVEQDYADIALFKVESHAFGAVFKLYELVGAHFVKAVDVGHAVAHFKHGAGFFEADLGVYAFELLFENFRYLAWINHWYGVLG